LSPFFYESSYTAWAKDWIEKKRKEISNEKMHKMHKSRSGSGALSTEATRRLLFPRRVLTRALELIRVTGIN
jgi:hypothetical protein